MDSEGACSHEDSSIFTGKCREVWVFLGGISFIYQGSDDFRAAYAKGPPGIEDAAHAFM